MLEIETILGEKVALNQKAKQKPNLAFQTIKTLDNELVNLDGVLENTMEEKRKLKQTLKDAKTDDEKVAAEEKIKQSDDKIDKITETKKIKEEEYQKAINAYINKKQAKTLENLQYPNIASDKATPEAEKIVSVDNFQKTEEYLKRQSKIQDNLQKELNSFGLGDFKVKVQPLIESPEKGKIIEGATFDTTVVKEL